ncbi:uncharacterized protein LOC129773349 [Toxorhynchites rutilus septentrionalis]|uniref:uncharacterized protein LOC129773349 n=1 Tax=Toxorhynchites rutilus septentrionalis TaxID=329112 RepID=UPI002479D0CD|nr:uncharacterized protein LOC129773349 [Toxorhynchites rutilus septentrionalis]
MSSILLYAIDPFVPVKMKREDTKPAWSNGALKYLKRVKQSALRQFSKHRTRAKYLKTNAEYKQLNNRLYSAYQDRLQSRLKVNPKRFSSYVKNQRKESGLPSTLTNGLMEADTTTDIADLFSSQFCNVFVNEHIDPQDVAASTRNVPRLLASELDFVITDDRVIAATKNMKTSTGCGPDERCWKQSYVFPVYKKGHKRSVSNYRGIAALCATSKLFELIVLQALMQSCSQYISLEQHGFMPKRSTNLTCFTSFMIHQIENGLQVDAIYTYLSAAFDKMNHRIAVAKFDKLGMSNQMVIWIRSYLTGRSMSVKIGDHVSSPFPVWSGVPQGSHLGSFLFLLYMNDVNFTMKCLKLSYADDLSSTT